MKNFFIGVVVGAVSLVYVLGNIVQYQDAKWGREQLDRVEEPAMVLPQHMPVVYAPAVSEPEPTVSNIAMVDRAAAAILKKDGPAAAREFRDAIEVNIRPALQEDLAPIVAAIRHSENGAAGKEYGVLGPGVRRDMERRGATYRPQAGWCAATVQKTFDRWVEAGKPGTFIEYLGNRYCPVGAENDPTGLNGNWQRNVSKWDATIRG